MADIEKNDSIVEKEDIVNEKEDIDLDDDETQDDDSDLECGDDEDSSSSLPFPTATVVRQVKKRTGNKMISSKVKLAMNEFLGEVVSSVSDEMGKTRYSMIEMDDFQRATKPYTYARELEKEKERVVGELEKMKEDLESLIREFQRKFAMASVDDFSVLKNSNTDSSD